MGKIAKQSLYTERVLPGISFYLACLVIPGALFLIALPFGENLAYLSVLVATVAVFAISYAGAAKIQISEDELQVGKARIQISLLGASEVIQQEDQQVQRGRGLDARAYTKFQFGVKGLIKIQINDANDATPYWLISTRQPEIVAGILSKRTS